MKQKLLTGAKAKFILTLTAHLLIQIDCSPIRCTEKVLFENSYDYEEFLQYGSVAKNGERTLEEILSLEDPIAIKSNNVEQNCVAAIEVKHFLHHKHFSGWLALFNG